MNDAPVNFDYDAFMRDVNARFITHSSDQRYGQFLMNEFYKLCPNAHIPEHADCFYDNSKTGAFLQFIFKFHDNKYYSAH